MNHRATRQSGAVEPEELDAWGWGGARKKPAPPPVPLDNDDRFEHIFESLGQDRARLDELFTLMKAMTEKIELELDSIKSQLKPTAKTAARQRVHDTPLFLLPP